MKSLFNKILITLPLVTILAACSGDNLDADLASKDYLNTESAVDIVAGAESATFQVSANCGWSITPDNAWIHVTPMAGNGNTTVTVTPDANNDTDSRTGFITITSNEGVTRVVTINQAPGQVILSLTPTTMTFTWEGGTQNLTVACNTEWEIVLSGQSSWLHIANDNLSGKGNKTFAITADRKADNYTNQVAYVTVRAKGTNGETTSATTTVTMLSRNGIINGVQAPTEFKYYESTETIRFYSNTAWRATISQGRDYAQFNDGSDDITGAACATETDRATLSIKVSDNLSINTRPVTIVLTTLNEHGDKATETINITQAAATLPTVSDLTVDENSVSKKGANVSFKYASTSFAVESYILQVSTDADFNTFDQTAAVVTGSPMTIALDNLLSGTTYFVRVKVKNKVTANNGESGWSNIVTFTTKAVPQEDDNDKPEVNQVRKK